LKGIHEEYIDILPLMGSGDISSLPFEKIVEPCKKCSRGKDKARKEQRGILTKVTKSTTRSISRDEIGNLLEKFKTEILFTLSYKLLPYNHTTTISISTSAH
jgi:hypothetical protein